MRVFIAGVASPLGRLLAAHLIADPAVSSVTGLDEHACTPPVAGLRFIRAPLIDPCWCAALRDADAVIALYGMAWPASWHDRHTDAASVTASKHLVEAAAAAGVSTLIMAHSTALYGAQPAQIRISERASVRGYAASAYARARAQVADYLTLRAPTYPGTLTELRAAWLCGSHHVGLLRQFTHEPVRVCGSEGHRLPLLHEADFVDAVRFALHQTLPGVYNVAAGNALSFDEIAALTGNQHACTPLPWLVLRAYVRWRWLRWRTPPLWVRALYRSAPLDVSKLAAAGWQAAHNASAALIDALDVLRA